ncbi:MAG: hypothetical protein WD602_06150 [Actinomycetota bacterium]
MSSIFLVAAVPAVLLGWILIRDFMAGLDEERVWSDEQITDNDLAA